MTFTRLSMLAGVLLILVTLYTLAAVQNAYFTAFLPAIAGAITILLGGLAERSGAVQAQSVTAITAVAALTFVGSLRLLFVLNDPTQSQAGLIAQLAALIISGVVLVIGVRLLLQARQRSAG
jgi:fucose 4-O-acetylase-like acetyltransferase